MAHYAWLNENNLVINVTVGVDEDIVQQGVGGSTEAWEAFYYQATGHTIKRTSYNNNIRKQYAGIGYTYDAIDDAFIAPEPCEHEELILNDLKLWECLHPSHVVIPYDL